MCLLFALVPSPTCDLPVLAVAFLFFSFRIFNYQLLINYFSKNNNFSFI